MKGAVAAIQDSGTTASPEIDKDVDQLRDRLNGPKAGLNRFKLGGALAIAKKQKEKEDAALASVKKQGVDPLQAATMMCGFFLFFWITASGVLSTMFTLRYIGLVREEQSWYMLNGAADSARAEAAHALGAARRVTDALHTAVQSGHIATSYDYAAIERTLAPTMLHTPAVRSVDLSFSDSNCGLRLSHRSASDVGEHTILLQSDAPDCFLMGPEGCIDLGVERGNPPPYAEVIATIGMPEKGIGDGDARLTRKQIIEWTLEAPRQEQWNREPTLVQSRTDEGGVVWIPSIRLEFRLPLPSKWLNDERHLLVGYVSFETTSLSGSQLLDATLGPKGRSFLVDRNGMVLSAQISADTIQVEKETHRLNFRHLKDLPDSGWASQLDGAFQNGKIKELQISNTDGLAVVVAPLKEPLQDFAVVVVGYMEGSSFEDSTVFNVMITLCAFASMPFLITLLFLLSAFAATGEGEGAGKKKTTALGRVTQVVLNAGSAVRRRANFGRSLGRPKSPQETQGVRVITRHDDRRESFALQDVMFEEQASKSWKGKCAICLRRFLGKGRSA